MKHSQAEGEIAILMQSNRGRAKGFTLIELIITISILAILVAIIVVAINPAEQLARARDAKRVADLDSLKSAMNLYLASATTTINLSGDSTVNNRCKNGPGTDTVFLNISTSSGSQYSLTTVTSTGQLVATSAPSLLATSWIPALMGQTPGGSPVPALPLDPTGTTGNGNYFYAYACESNNKTFELNSVLESSYFKSDLDIDGTDGGNDSAKYETGSDLTIL